MSCCIDGDLKLLFSKVTPMAYTSEFLSPKESGYTIDEVNKQIVKVKRFSLESSVFHRDIYSTTLTTRKYTHLILANYHWLTNKAYIIDNPNKDSSIIVFYIQNKTLINNEQKFTILFSHGNAATLGTIYPFLFDLSTQLKCDVVAYDYNGYGHSKGKASEEAIKSNIDDVYILMRNILGIKKDNIIVYGISIGTVPSCFLCSKRSVAGLILHAPIASQKLLIDPSYELKEEETNDPFCNWNIVNKIYCPIFLIHGLNDDSIPFNHSDVLARKMNHLVKWFPKQGTHFNIYECYRHKFIEKTLSFLDFIFKKQLRQLAKTNKRKNSASSFEMMEKNGRKLSNNDTITNNNDNNDDEEIKFIYKNSSE